MVRDSKPTEHSNDKELSLAREDSKLTWCYKSEGLEQWKDSIRNTKLGTAAEAEARDNTGAGARSGVPYKVPYKD